MEDIIHEEMIVRLERLLLNAVRSFVESMYEFNESVFNAVSLEDSWSAAEVSSHIYKSMKYIHTIVEGEGWKTERSSQQFTAALKTMMEDMNVKGRAASILLPEMKFMLRTDVRKDLTEAEQLLLKDIRVLDLSQICKGIEIPGIGYLTRFELISFCAFHITRHMKQLQNIRKALMNTKAILE